jgi:uncharacterized SAM-binding protein YcdF (DUF218 family)
MREDSKPFDWRRLYLIFITQGGFVKMVGIITIASLLICFSSNLFSSLETPNNIEHRVENAIIVLGGGVMPNGDVPEHTLLRVQKAVELYKELNGNARIIPLSGGTPYKPNPRDDKGFPIWEATAAAKKLIALGVPPAAIFEEAFSLDTIGNVSSLDLFFSRIFYYCCYMSRLIFYD